jgi:hypothetical protein
MQRYFAAAGLIVIILMGVVLTPVRAQDGFTPEEQAALDEIHTALLNLVNVTTYTANVSQQMDQNIIMLYQGQTVRLNQSLKSEGRVTVEQRADTERNDREMHLVQTVTQALTGAGQDQEATVGPLEYDLIVADERIYMQIKVPPEQAGSMPTGWQDVTEGASMFPGMSMYNIDAFIDLGNLFESEYISGLIDAVLSVEILESAAADEHHYRLTLEPSLLLEAIGSGAMAQLFDAERVPFDLSALLDRLYTDEDTRFTLELFIGTDTQTLREYREVSIIDADIDPELITDPTLKEVEMTIQQKMSQVMRFSNLNAPVTITAPVVEE